MSQNLKVTVSNSQLLSDSQMVPIVNDKNTIKKVTSLNCGEIETKQKVKVDHKAFKVKLTIYKSTLKNFNQVCNDLKTSFESMKHLQKDLLENNNDQKFEELDTTVRKVYF